jgi:glutathione S-transferase
MKLYGCAKTRSDRVRWVLEEIGVAYDYVSIQLSRGEGRTPEFLALNPGGKVPALEVDGEILTESAAICRFLGDRYPEAALVPPAGTVARGHMDQWCDFAIAELEQPLWTLSKHRAIYPEARRVPAIEAVALWEFERAARVLSEGLKTKPCILGEQFSVADVLLTHTLAWAKGYNVNFPGDNLVAYMERHLARPALQRVRDKNRNEGRDPA